MVSSTNIIPRNEQLYRGIRDEHCLNNPENGEWLVLPWAYELRLKEKSFSVEMASRTTPEDTLERLKQSRFIGRIKADVVYDFGCDITPPNGPADYHVSIVPPTDGYNMILRWNLARETTIILDREENN